MNNLIYHSEGSYDREESLFDAAIRGTVDSGKVRIVCPYIGPSYLKSILREVDEWRIVTDVETWIGMLGSKSRGEVQEFIEEHQERVRNGCRTTSSPTQTGPPRVDASREYSQEHTRPDPGTSLRDQYSLRRILD